MKNTSHNRWYRTMIGPGLATLIIAGCASVPPPPTDQIAESKMAVSNAANAGGNEFASAEMRGARDKLDRAIKAMTEEKYESARLLAEQAETDARLATAMARSAKAEKAAATIQEDSRVLREELNRQ